jgi:hypothetical protein
MPLSMKKLRRALAAFGAWEESHRGKGGHTAFLCNVEGKTQLYPIPNKREVADCYVRGVRRKFKLTADDGISDEEFLAKT